MNNFIDSAILLSLLLIPTGILTIFYFCNHFPTIFTKRRMLILSTGLAFNALLVSTITPVAATAQSTNATNSTNASNEQAQEKKWILVFSHKALPVSGMMRVIREGKKDLVYTGRYEYAGTNRVPDSYRWSDAYVVGVFNESELVGAVKIPATQFPRTIQ